MTTPEKLRRRQRREGIALMVLGVAMTVTTIYQTHERNQQKDDFQECITSVVAKLTDTLDARSNLSQGDAKATRDFLLSVPTLDTKEKFQRALQEYIDAQAKLAKIRKENPIPPFPDGTCE